LLLGALLMGACGMGVYGIVPSYLTERFPTAARSVGPGFAYHAGAALGSVTPAFVGALQDRGVALPGAMAGCIAVSGVLVAVMIWLGPETRGRSFTPSA
jgi:SHS family lactate transporter-like MFS transporter